MEREVAGTHIIGGPRRTFIGLVVGYRLIIADLVVEMVKSDLDVVAAEAEL